MIKSLLLAVVCGYTNPPGLQPNVPAVQVHFDLLKELGMAGLQGAEAAAANAAAGRPFWQLAPEHVAAEDLCSKLAAERAATSEALNAFVDPTATWHLQPQDAYAMEPVPMPKPRPGGMDANYTKYGPQVRKWHRHPQPQDAYAMEPASIDPRSGNRGRKFGLPGSDADYRRYQ